MTIEKVKNATFVAVLLGFCSVVVARLEAKAYNRHFPFLYDLSGGGLIAFSEMNPYVTGRQAGVSL